MRKTKKIINAGFKNIVFLGLVSFFADISSEMVYPLIPLYLTSAFGATPVLVGIIEGIAESLASLLKVFSGYFTDKYKNKKPVAFIGYFTGVIYKFALIFSASWLGILSARVIDKIGKGIRTAPRDVLISESSDDNAKGRAFGLHKALDMAGSAIGILTAFLIMRNSADFNYKKLFLISVIPVIISLFMFIFIKEKKVTGASEKKYSFNDNIKNLNKNLKLYLVVAFLFTLGNSSNTFLLLRAKNVGFNDSTVVLLYFIYNVTASLFAMPFGRLSDKLGRKKVLVSGYITFSCVYLGFAFVKSSYLMILIFIVYGFYTAMTAGVERAFISEIAPYELKGTMLGLHSTVVGIALLPASIIAGLMWKSFGAAAPFIFGSALSFIAAAILLFFLKSANK